MSLVYKERVLKRLAKLIRKHKVQFHAQASSHTAFAKEFRKREDCWEHLFLSAMKYLRSNKDELTESDTEEISQERASRRRKNKKKKKSRR